MRNEKGQFVKGFRSSKETEFKKGVVGEKHNRWKGGRYFDGRYFRVKCLDHPKATKGNKGYIYEHILVAEKKIGRYLKEGECVHHINRNKKDNSQENIMVFSSNSEHILHHGKTNKWSRKYDNCIECKTTKLKHEAYGLCRKCYSRKRRKK